MSPPVVRVAHRRVRPQCAKAYEALVRGMFEDARQLPGFLGAELTPPIGDGDEYRVALKFATDADLDRWNRSEARAQWHARLAPLADGDPEYHLLSGMEAWFVPPPVPSAHPPSRARMTVVTWLGIFPTVSLLLYVLGPALAPLPYLLRTAILTAIVVPCMTYVVMPRLTRALRDWLHAGR
ncbi:MAG: antibiotic biosynthesis monooxygenase [Denitromonas halophila]|nr:MAG: antibiotic biosynthesis monooxygenase [Denitromonas halophila]TVT68950.1 MAG: antibiotic biosynthesis monooxygenase [Denitromonas halophila]